MAARRRVAHPRIVLVIAAVAAMTGCLYGPPYDQLLSGDEELLEYAREKFGDGTDRVAMAVIDGDEVRTAFVSTDPSTMFELGTGTRFLTGLLLAEAIERGEVALDDPVGEYLPLGDSAAASVTLRALATQYSGLPVTGPLTVWHSRTAESSDDTVETDDGGTGGEEAPAPAISLDEMLEAAKTAPVSAEPHYEFNELQAALLGNALAAAADRDYAELLQERVLDPLGMDDAVLVEETEDVPDALAKPKNTSSSGGAVAPGAFAPAVGVVVTIDDIIALARGLFSGEFADSEAFGLLEDTPWGKGIGYFWEVDSSLEGEVRAFYGWSRTFCVSMAADVESRRAVIVLRNSGDTYPWDEATDLLAIVRE
ncbi:serine hydrolase domain-containing protein [Agromyces bracchium]|uniref:Serine hydrolase n=1 Tax=Agromyces bracchium TaxID=88376 RepID=A0A6I3MBM4_9MICO|nr:serine hydrolase domain-containing protein [Agromyces bracchium]MTH67873.1 serine hydrolase [Agromyces bracchium]